MNILNELHKELEKFWSWAGIENHDEYDLDQLRIADVCLYSDWDRLLRLTKQAVIILSEEHAHKELNEKILLVMGLDHEDGEILEKCEQELQADAALNFAKDGIRYPFFQTRWQIAEFIRLKKDVVLDDYLPVLLEDQDPYVQRRALLAMAERTPSLATECAWKKITADDFMMRLVSLRILDELVSSRLTEAL